MLRPIFMDPSFCDDRKGAAAKLVNSAVQSRGPPTARSATAQIGISARPVRQLGNMLHQLDRQTKVAMSAIGGFCCKSLLKAMCEDDSVSLERFATGADDDGAAQPRSGAVFLFVSA